MVTEPGDRKIVIVGPCASGKSTLAAGLTARGWDAAVSGQEHSEIPQLWRRQAPDLLIYLHVELDTIRSRRGEDWSASIYERQLRRLENARQHASLIVDTSMTTPDALLELVERHLRDSIA